MQRGTVLPAAHGILSKPWAPNCRPSLNPACQRPRSHAVESRRQRSGRTLQKTRQHGRCSHDSWTCGGGNAWTCKAQGLLGAKSNFFTRRGETVPETWLSATPSALLRLPKPARIVERPRHKKNRNASGSIKSLNPHGIVKQSLGIPSILFATLSLGNSLSQHILVITAPLKNDDLSREIPTAPFFPV